MSPLPPRCLYNLSAGFCLCCGTENVEVFHPLFKGSLCLKCKVRNHHLLLILQPAVTNSNCECVLKYSALCCLCLCRITLQKLCIVTMKMDTSPTAPSAAMGWRSYCVAKIAAAGSSVHLLLSTIWLS